MKASRFYITIFITTSISCAFMACVSIDSKSNEAIVIDSSITVNPTDSNLHSQLLQPVSTQSKWIDTIRRISFVKISDAYIDSLTNHQQKLTFIEDTTIPGKIKLTAGYNGKRNFEVYYNFNIDKNTGNISVVQPVTGTLISIAAFQKYLKK